MIACLSGSLISLILHVGGNRQLSKYHIIMFIYYMTMVNEHGVCI